jgi:hypothetical protein
VDAVAVNDSAVGPTVLEDRILERNEGRLGATPAGRGWLHEGGLDIGLGIEPSIEPGVGVRITAPITDPAICVRRAVVLRDLGVASV